MLRKHQSLIIVLLGLVALGSGFWMFFALSDRPSGDPAVARVVQANQEPFMGPSTVSMTYTSYFPLVLNTHPFENNFGLQIYETLDTSKILTLTAEGGAGWIRFPLRWRHIEPNNTTPEYYNWSYLDPSMTAAKASNLNIMFTITEQPEWAAPVSMGVPYDRSELAEFLAAVVERYDGDGTQDAPGQPIVRYYELYNEPDMTIENVMGSAPWGYKGAEYASLLAYLYPVLKEANPRAKLVVGGLASDGFDDKGGPFARSFLDDVLSACVGVDCFDVMNFHYYPAFHKEWDPYGPGFMGKAIYFRQKLEEYGKADRALICSETGSRGHPDWGGDEQQSRYVVKAFVRGRAAGLPIVIWFTALDTTIPESLYGLYDESYRPKPSYDAFATASSMIVGSEYAWALSSKETGSPDLEGYLFSRPDGRSLIVIWTEDDSKYNPDDNPSVPFTVNKTSLTVTDKYGYASQRHDHDDGVTDQKVTLTIDGSPVFIEY